jgi:hypoxanthine phosphoribosyltransferase
MVMITMGALLPGVLLHDYVTYATHEALPSVEFGTFGVRFYHGPGQPLAQPEIIQPLSIDVRGHVVGIVEDLADLGRTAKYVQSVLLSEQYGARETLLIAPFRKTATTNFNMETITFGVVPQDTWIITPRERVETMMKRVPYWAEQGATKEECHGNLANIGYPSYLLDAWFDVAWDRCE